MTRTYADPYTVLGVPRSADAAQVKVAYRQLAMKYHPDRNPGDKGAEERFKEISEAYATLRDPDLRARYDRYGQTGASTARPDFGTMDWQTIFQEADIRVDWGPNGQMPRTGNAVFDALFGAMTGMMRSSGLLPGEDREVSLPVSVLEARRGATRRVRVPGPSVCSRCRGSGQGPAGFCEICGGRGVVRSGAEVEVEVPPFRKDDTKLRLRGLGGPGRPPGDAYVHLHVQVPAGVRLEADGSLHSELTLLPREAERGVTTPLLGTDVQVPQGSRAGDTLRVPGGGIGGGDMVLTLQIDFWGGLWRRVKHALS